jgi:hypothetical protein
MQLFYLMIRFIRTILGLTENFAQINFTCFFTRILSLAKHMLADYVF